MKIKRTCAKQQAQRILFTRHVAFKKVTFLTSLLLLLCASSAYAEGDVGTIERALKGLTDILMGGTAKSIAVLAIAGMGYLTLAGKMAWQKAILICLGIGIIFGAKTIASLLGAS